MKKNLLFIAFCSSILMFVGCKPSKEESKKAFTGKCILSVPATVPKDIAEEYCNCSADALLSKYSVEEIGEMEKKITAGDMDAKNKMLQDVQPCMMQAAEKARVRATSNKGQ